ncbi:hypothetical protein FI667_g5715, partial [Globisporangium splendens]
MLQRRQHKAQRRRLHGGNHETTNASRSNVRTKTEEHHVLYLVIVVCALLIAIVTLNRRNDDGDSPSAGFLSDVNAVAKSIRWLFLNYPSRFYAFYVPKIVRVWQWMTDVYDAIEIPDDVASVFHIIDSARRSFVASLRSAEHTSKRDAQPGKENADESVSSAF